MEKSLLSWFTKRHESIVVRKASEHAGKLVDTSIELLNAIKFASNGVSEDAKKALHALNAYEKDADTIETLIQEEVSRAEIEPREREYLMRMIRHQDYAADWIKEAGMNLEIFIDLKLSCPDEIWKDLIKICESLVETTKSLKRTIEELARDMHNAQQCEKNVEVLEHKIDEMYFEAKKHVLSKISDPRAMIVLREILHGMENSADNCKDTGDMLKMLILAGL
jgi:predicted phosphate transport protein (TIGR00153 family)